MRYSVELVRVPVEHITPMPSPSEAPPAYATPTGHVPAHYHRSRSDLTETERGRGGAAQMRKLIAQQGAMRNSWGTTGTPGSL